jgi:hypothetical protein
MLEEWSDTTPPGNVPMGLRGAAPGPPVRVHGDPVHLGAMW